MFLSILCGIGTVLWWTCGILILWWWYKEVTMGLCLSKKRLDGRVVVITGGTSGIGFETALDLAKRGATVIFTSRSSTNGEKTETLIRKLSGNKEVYFKQLDLASQRDTKRFAKELSDDYQSIDYLINNAGMVGDPAADFKAGDKSEANRRNTEDGFDLIMATNFLGHVTLTEALVKNLRAGAEKSGEKARVVHVSSLGHSMADLDVNDLDINRRKKRFNSGKLYNNSKLAQILYSHELARRLQGSNVESVSLHPGLVRTGIFREVTDFVTKVYILITFWLLGKNNWQGAQTTIEAVVSEKDLNGKYLSDCREAWWVSKKRIGNPETQAKFYKEIIHLLGITSSC